MNKLPWLTEARKEIGQHEIKGPASNPRIDQFWRDSKLSGLVGTDDTVPWCAAFVNACLERAGIRSVRSDSSRSYLTFGKALKEPKYGCIAVFSRQRGGHVGFVVGKTESGLLLVLGGNQADEVNIKAFSTDRVIGYRWPSGVPVDNRSLPVGNAVLSVKEL
ncbi:TPA: TIGR02594 family protein [Morganella morganii]|uniref:NlpC/P60 family protein n=1 Tax=Morganella morganii TaxID=582 RepID=UPI001BDA8A5E|nr:TIGR02594 family protein [Morganella morganii]MBT0380759.1 TIGR02594 family protein [Morganella morganii subsp. morganii]HDU8609733.1 TIGR02594 family protein [Morganella morganii]